MQPVTGSARDHLLLVLRTAKDRLEYLTQNDWALLVDRAKQRCFKREETLIERGKPTRLVHLLLRGTARVESAPGVTIAHIGPGDICGEMSFLQRSPASASVIAEEDLETYAVDWAVLDELFELFPHLASRFYHSLAVRLSQRLREQIGPRSADKK
jgi:CRP-like cAMP-binding protein